MAMDLDPPLLFEDICFLVDGKPARVFGRGYALLCFCFVGTWLGTKQKHRRSPLVFADHSDPIAHERSRDIHDNTPLPYEVI